MSTPINEIWLAVAGHLERLDLDEETNLLPTFQANDRTKPESIQSEYGPEFSVPGTTGNHRRLRHAAASQPTTGSAYVRVPAVLTSGGVETMPLALLYLKGYSGGRYQLQLFGGNKRFVAALGEKMLSDLDFSRFNHEWTSSNVLTGLSYYWWQSRGWGYEIYDRGKPIDFANLDPFTCYPSVAGWLVLQQILADAGFTADDLMSEPLAQQLNVPTANPYVFPQKFRDARALQAGFEYDPAGQLTNGHASDGLYHGGEFAPERIPFTFTSQAPYHQPTEGTTYDGHTFTVDTLGYYDIKASVYMRYGCTGVLPGQVSCKVSIYINGAPVVVGGSQVGFDYHRITDNSETDGGGGYMNRMFSVILGHWLLQPGDVVEIWWQGDEWTSGGISPFDPFWNIGPHGSAVPLPSGNALNTQDTFSVVLQEEFPHGGLVKLNEWLPEMKQLDFVKAYMLGLGLTIQTDDYRPHLHLATGNKLLENVYQAPDWTRKRDAFAQPGRLPERDLAFRFGEYGQTNYLKWLEDEHVTPGYGDGQLLVADEVLAREYTMATLPFAATEDSKEVAGLLRIQNFQKSDITVNPPTYSVIEAKPRLVLRQAEPAINGYLDNNGVLQAFVTTPSYFAGVSLSLLLNTTVLGRYWADLRAMLDESRYLVERYRLTPQDIAELDFSIPIWDGVLGDYFAVSAVSEYDARRPTEVRLARLNASHLPPPVAPGEVVGREFYLPEFYTAEFY